jgi:hypothetical protein
VRLKSGVNSGSPGGYSGDQALARLAVDAFGFNEASDQGNNAHCFFILINN